MARPRDTEIAIAQNDPPDVGEGMVEFQLEEDQRQQRGASRLWLFLLILSIHAVGFRPTSLSMKLTSQPISNL